MNINERVRLIRNQLNMTQTEFGARLSITQNHLSGVEIGRREVSDRLIKIMCHEFNVNEHWLRIGEGEMFEKTTSFSLDEYAKKSQLTELDIEIVKIYMDLDPAVRKQFMNKVKNMFVKSEDETSATVETAAPIEKTPEEIVEEDVENYRLEKLAELKGVTLSASRKPLGELG